MKILFLSLSFRLSACETLLSEIPGGRNSGGHSGSEKQKFHLSKLHQPCNAIFATQKIPAESKRSSVLASDGSATFVCVKLLDVLDVSTCYSILAIFIARR